MDLSIWLPAMLGLGLLVIGLMAVTLGGAYVTIVRSRGGDPVTGVSVAMRF